MDFYWAIGTPLTIIAVSALLLIDKEDEGRTLLMASVFFACLAVLALLWWGKLINIFNYGNGY